MRSLIVRIGFSLVVVAALGLTAMPAVAKQVADGPTLVVANPSPGNMVTPGSLIMEGVAFDPSATQGVGVDRVSVFLENRDTGGEHLGDATLGLPNTMTTEPAQFGSAGWALTTPALKGLGDGYTLFVYARSGVTGAETVMQIPITVGEKVHNTGGGGEEPATLPAE
jgi:hypothetical protein